MKVEINLIELKFMQTVRTNAHQGDSNLKAPCIRCYFEIIMVENVIIYYWDSSTMSWFDHMYSADLR